MNGKYWCWGCGCYFKSNIEIIKKKYQIIGVVDIDSTKWGERVAGFEIQSPEVIDKRKDEIIITTLFFENVVPDLIKFGISVDRVKYWEALTFAITDLDVQYEDKYGVRCYSQEGEELFLNEKYAGKTNGVYVDVGCHHPFRFSNTNWAYKIGWHGINIDPNPEAIKLFEQFRPKDINIACAISDAEGMMDYYTYAESAINSLRNDRTRVEGNVVKNVYSVLVRRLESILEDYQINKIDFLDIDVEGLEENVLKSIDFSKVQIDTILVEQLPLSPGFYGLEDILNSDINKMLSQYGYICTNKFGRTVVYELKKTI